MTNDHRRTIAVLWLTLAATMAASWTHLTQFLARHEVPGWWPVAALAATAVDLGIVAAMLAISDMASAGRSTAGPRWTVAGLVALSCMVNAAHVVMVGASAGPVEMALAIAASAALPLIVWRLSLLLDALRRPAAIATAARVATVPASARVPVSRPASAKKAAQRPVQRAAVGNARARVLAVLQTAPADASARELARLAGTGDATVLRMVEAGTIARNGHGWQAPGQP